MPSKTLSEIRETYPQLNHVPDNELTVRVGNDYPKLLELDKEFASEHEKLTSFTAGGAAYDVYTRGVKGGLLNLLGIASGVVEAGAAELEKGPFGAPAVVKKILPDVYKSVTGKIQEWADTAGDFYEEKSAEQVAIADANMPSDLERGLGKLTSVATTAIAPLAAGPVGGYGAVIAASGLTTFGSTYRSAKNSYEEAGNPDAHGTAAKIALADGIKTSVITAIGGAVAQKLGGADLDKLTSVSKTPMFKDGLMQFFKKLGIGVTVEGLEEGIDEGMSAAIAQHTYNPDADISDAFVEALLFGSLLGGAGITLGKAVSSIKKKARKLKDAGATETAEKVLRKDLEALQKEEAQKAESQPAEPKEAPEAKLEENLKNTPTGGTKPVDQLPEAPQSQLDAMPEVEQDLADVDLEEVPTEEELSEGAGIDVEMSPEQEAEAEARQLTDDDIRLRAEQRVKEDLGIENAPANAFDVIPYLSSTQKEIYDDQVKLTESQAQPTATPQEEPITLPDLKLPKALSGAKPRYSYQKKQFSLNFESDVDKAAYITAQKRKSKKDQDYLDFATQATGMSDEQVREHGAKVREAIKDIAKNSEAGKLTLPPVDTGSRNTTEETETTPTIPIPEKYQSDYNEALKILETQLSSPWENMRQRKGKKGQMIGGRFKWQPWAGQKANRAINPTAYPTDFGGLERNANLVESFQEDVRTLAENVGANESVLLEELKQTVFKKKQAKAASHTKNKNTAPARTGKQDKANIAATLDNNREGSDILEDLADNLGSAGQLIVPVNTSNKISFPKDKRTSEHDGIDDYLSAVSAWFSKHPDAAKVKFRKVSHEVFRKEWRADAAVAALKGFSGKYENLTTSDLYSELTPAVDRRAKRKDVNEVEEQDKAEAEFAKQQVEADEAADTVNDDQIPEAEESTADPFAALPPNLVNGVKIDAGTDGYAQDLMKRVAQLLPSIQKRLGGAKVTHIRIDETAEAPAYSAVRSGDFGTVYLNPGLLAQMEATNQLDLSRVIAEEIIHNYCGLAINQVWSKSGSTQTWQEYYESTMKAVHGEMLSSEVLDTVYYYSGGMTTGINALQSDPVSVAEEYLRILLQRDLTGSINEDLFEKVKDRPALRKIIDALRRFWNGLTRGFMNRSPVVRKLQMRTKFLLQDNVKEFPATDRATLDFMRTSASKGPYRSGDTQGFFAFNDPKAEADKIEKNDATPKPENGVNDNEGSHMGWLFSHARLKKLAGMPTQSPKQSAKELEEAQAKANQDFAQKLFAADSLSVADAWTENEAQGAQFGDYIDASISRYVQKQEETPLPDVALETIYTKLKETIAKQSIVYETDQELAFWYAYSRILNDARRYVMRHRNSRESDLEVLTGSDGSRKPFNLNLSINRKLKSFRVRRKAQEPRVLEKEQGIVSVDAEIPSASGDSKTVGEVMKVVNPFDVSPERQVVNYTIATALDKLVTASQESSVLTLDGGNERLEFKPLTRRQISMLDYGISENFRVGWEKDWAKKLGLTRGRASQIWSEIQGRLIAEMSTSTLTSFNRVDLAKAIKGLTPGVREKVEEAMKPLREQKERQEAIKKAREEAQRTAKLAQTNLEVIESMNDAITPPTRDEQLARRNLAALEQLVARNRNITSAAIPPTLTDLANQAKAYRAKADPTASVVDNDARTEVVKQRMQDAESTQPATIVELHEQAIEMLKNAASWSRTYRHLDPSKYAEVIDELRLFEENQTVSYAKALDTLRGITSGLNAKQMDKFRRILILRDLKRSVDEGLYKNYATAGGTYNTSRLPFGFRTDMELEAALVQDEQDLLDPQNKPIADALERRSIIYKDITGQLQKAGLLPKDIATGEEYFHRITLEHIANKRKYESSKSNKPAPDLRTGRAGFQKKRKGSSKDYLTNYIASEEEVLSQSYAQLETVQKIATLKGLLDKKKSFISEANKNNMRNLVDQGIDPTEFNKEANKKIAIAISSLRKLIKDGSLAYAPKYNGIAGALEQQQRHPDFFAFLKHLSSTNSGGQMYANMIFKAIRKKETDLKNQIGDLYVTWRDVVNQNSDYTTWQIEEGNFLYKGTVASDQVLTDWYAKADPGDSMSITPKQLSKALVLGGRKEEWVIPNEAAQELQSLKYSEFATGDGIGSKFTRLQQKLLAKWKYWKLYNPISLTKYEINNMSGDADIVFAYDPKIISQYAKQAAIDLFDYHKNNAPIADAGLEDMLRKGVIGSGYQMQDLAEMNSDIAYEAMFGDIVDSTRPKSKWFKRFTDGYTKRVAKYNQMREDILRVAAYRYFIDQFEAGKNPVGVSNRAELDQLSDNTKKAAKLSRELLGDYGALSAAGKYIRSNIIPFYSWMEINAPRYVRLMRNAVQEGQGVGRTAGVAAKRGAVKATTTALLAQTLPFFVNGFNEFMIAIGAVDEEDKRVIDARNQQHLLLLSTEGRVISFRMQGALTDALEWFGLGSAYSTGFDVLAGRLNLGDASEDYFSTGEYWKGAAQRISSGFNPFIKLPVEVVTKSSWYPDVFNRSPMRDPLAYALNTLTVGWGSSATSLAYNLSQNFPTRGVTGGGSLASTMINAVAFSTDTGEAAYNYIKSKEYQFARSKDGDVGNNTTIAKQDALYYYNKARSFGDESAAKRWKQEYLDLGGKVSGIKRSNKGRAPLAKVKPGYRKEFLQSLSEVERALLDSAKLWHKNRIK